MKDRFTEDGRKAMETRLRSFVKLYVEGQNYPLTFRLYGFPPETIKNKDYPKGMIDNLKEILDVKIIIR